MATTRTKKNDIPEIVPAVEEEQEQVTEQMDEQDIDLDEVLKGIKPVIIHMPGKDYTLEFDRDSVKFAEAHDFKIDEVDEKQMLRVEELFYFAFRKHHMNVSRQQTDKILYEDLGGITPALIARLTLLFMVPYKTLFNQTGKPKNPKVTVEF